MREIGKADVRQLDIHHPHYISQFAKDAQRAVWAGGLDIAIAASILPSARVTPVDGGYRISGQFPFASGINHSRWVIVGGAGFWSSRGKSHTRPVVAELLLRRAVDTAISKLLAMVWRAMGEIG